MPSKVGRRPSWGSGFPRTSSPPPSVRSYRARTILPVLGTVVEHRLLNYSHFCRFFNGIWKLQAHRQWLIRSTFSTCSFGLIGREPGHFGDPSSCVISLIARWQWQLTLFYYYFSPKLCSGICTTKLDWLFRCNDSLNIWQPVWRLSLNQLITKNAIKLAIHINFKSSLLHIDYGGHLITSFCVALFDRFFGKWKWMFFFFFFWNFVSKQLSPRPYSRYRLPSLARHRH